MLSSLLLVCLSLGVIGATFDDAVIYTVAEFVGLTGFLALELRRISHMARALVFLSLALPAYAFASGSFDADLTLSALHRGAYLAFFLTSLSFLQHAAGRSPLILRSGQVLVMQPPGRRYLVLTFGAALFGMLLNLGTVGLLGTMIAKAVGPGDDAESTRIANIRRKRMTLAMLRGFCALPMWSPMTITIALVIAAIPSLSWGQMVIYSAPMTVLFLLIGWGLDRSGYARAPLPDQPPAPSLLKLLPLLTIVVLVPTTAFAASQVLGTNLITALLICIPFLSFGWIFIQERGAPTAGTLRKTAGIMGRDLLPSLPNMRTEIALFACSAFIGVMVTASVDTVRLGHAIIALGLSADTLLVLSAWLVFGLSLMGISPIISVTILAGTLPNLAALEINEMVVGVMLLTVWTISVNATPFSAAVRMSARLVTVEPTLLGMRWNGLYCLISLGILSVFLLVAQ